MLNEEKRDDGMDDFMRGILEEFSSRKEEDVVAKLAGFLYGYYSAFQAAGFNEERAFAMVMAILINIIKKA